MEGGKSAVKPAYFPSNPDSLARVVLEALSF
jgi:hypothetical protein